MFNRKKIVVYTAIFGDKDHLIDPAFKFRHCDYICFTDNPQTTSDVYRIVTVPGFFKDPVRSSKVFKILPHVFLGNYKWSLWVDGHTLIKKFDIRHLISKYLSDKDAAFFKHPNRDCIYEEFKACVRLKKDDTTVMEDQITLYKKNGYPAQNGLIAGGVILRAHTTEVMRRVNEDWWREIVNHSRRDQLSFNYIAWKHDFLYSIIDGYLWDNEYFRFEKHLY